MKNKKILTPYDNDDFKKLSAFINNYLNDTIYYDIAINEVLKLACFIEENLASFSHTLLYEIVGDNQKLANLLEIIINNLSDVSKIECTFDNEILVLLLRAYAMHKGLIETNLEEFKDILDFDYYNSSSSSHVVKFEKPKLSVNAKRNLLAKEKTEAEKTQLFECYFSIVLQEAKYYAKGQEAYKDLVQEGSIYLMEAISLFDASKNIPFYTYCHQLIRQRLIRYIQSKGKYNFINFKTQSKMSLLKKVIYDMEIQGKEYTLADIAEKVNLTEEEVKEALILSSEILNYDDIINDEHLPYDMTSLSNPAFEDEVVKSPNIMDHLKNLNLTPKEINAVYLKYFKNFSLRKMEQELNLSHSRIDQLLAGVSWRLLRYYTSPSLTEYLDSPDFGLELISDARSTNYRGPSSPINCLCDPYFKDFSSLEKLLKAHPLEIKIILANLPIDDVRFIHKVYGDNLNENNISKLSLLEINHLYNHLYYKMLEILNGTRKYIANLDEYDEQVLSVLDNPIDQTLLNLLDFNLIKKYFNYDEIEIIYLLLLKQLSLKDLLNEININKENIYIILSKLLKLKELVNNSQEQNKKRVLAPNLRN